MKRLVASLVLLSVFIGACSTPGTVVVIEETATPTQVPPTDVPPTETPAPTEQSPAVQAAVQALAGALGLDVADITVVNVEAVEWPDSCLGIVDPLALCAQGIVPGFRISLAADGQEYEYHTNSDGAALAVVGGTPTNAAPEVLAAVQQALADALGLDVSEIKVVHVTAQEWPNGCLGVNLPGQVCTEAIVPGYLVVVEGNGQQYDYRTNADGSVVRPGQLLLTWERNGGIAGFCDTLVLFGSGEAEALSCRQDAVTLAGALTAEERAQLAEWAAVYGTVEIVDAMTPMPADGMALKLVLYGSGGEQPDQATREALLLWAQDIHTRLGQ